MVKKNGDSLCAGISEKSQRKGKKGIRGRITSERESRGSHDPWTLTKTAISGVEIRKKKFRQTRVLPHSLATGGGKKDHRQGGVVFRV